MAEHHYATIVMPFMDHELRKKAGRSAQAKARPIRQDLAFGFAAAPAKQVLLLLQKGFPFKMLTALAAQSGIPVRELAAIIEIPERTLARRRVAGRLGRDESERLLRVARVIGKAVQLFEGDMGAAVAWLKAPQKALSHNTPLSYARFEMGAVEVENLIGRLEHGVFS
jgi:putative toxin-antitoxin system antitoxin component (TIGR02293 family)